MNILKKAIKLIVHHFEVDPVWAQREIARMTKNGPNTYDVILKGGREMNIFKKAVDCIRGYIKSNESTDKDEKVTITEYPAGVALRNW